MPTINNHKQAVAEVKPRGIHIHLAYKCHITLSLSTTVLSGAKERVAEERPGWNFQIFENMTGWKFEDKCELGKWVQKLHVAQLSGTLV